MKKQFILLLTLGLILSGCSSVNSNTNDIDAVSVNQKNEDTQLSISINQDLSSENDGQNALNTGGAVTCIHSVVHNGVEYDCSYHTIPGNLIQYVGEEAFEEWVEIKKNEDINGTESVDCSSITIVTFVDEFNIPREVFEVLNNNYFSSMYDYNLDAIYAGEEEAETYYTSERLQYILEKRTIRLMKMDLRTYVKKEDSNAITVWCTEKNTAGWGAPDATRTTVSLNNAGISYEFEALYSQYSLAEFINEFDIPSSVVAASYDKCKHPDYIGILNIEALCSINDATLFTSVNPLEIDRDFIIYNEGQTSTQ